MPGESSIPDRSDHKSKYGAQRLVPVYYGSFGQVIAMRAAAAAAGFDTFVEDELTKTFDPFVTGGNALVVTLCAPEDRAGEVSKWIRESGGTTVTEAEPATDREAKIRELAEFAERIRWCTLSIFPPLGIVLGFAYIQEVQRCGLRPEKHGWTIAAFWICILETTAFALSLVIIYQMKFA